jgi:hypothetical protein
VTAWRVLYWLTAQVRVQAMARTQTAEEAVAALHWVGREVEPYRLLDRYAMEDRIHRVHLVHQMHRAVVEACHTSDQAEGDVRMANHIAQEGRLTVSKDVKL